MNKAKLEPEDAFEQAFGVDYWEIDKQVRKYWYDYKLPVFSVDLSDKIDEISVNLRELTEVEAAAIDYEGRLRTSRLDGDEDEARAAFNQVLEAGHRPQETRRMLAQLALIEDDFEAAEAQIAALLDADPQSAPALTLNARLMREQLEEEEPSAEDLAPIRSACIRAIRADPTYVPALMTFARLHLADALTADGTVLKIVESIRFLAPDYREGQVLEARLLAKAGRFEDAMSATRKLIDWAPTRGMRRDYESLLEKIQEQRAETTDSG